MDLSQTETSRIIYPTGLLLFIDSTKRDDSFAENNIYGCMSASISVIGYEMA